jgi:glycerol-3-phosphate dehydrogenase
LVSIVGGSSHHRALAEDVARAAQAIAPTCRLVTDARAAAAGCAGCRQRDRLLADLGARFGASRARRLWETYGKAAADIASLAARKELAGPIDGDSGILVAELVHAIEVEWAVTLEDLLQRRCMAGLAGDFGLGAAPGAAAALVRLGIWDSARAARELAAYRELAVRHGVPV